MVKLIAENIQESRREWLLNAFAKAGKLKSNVTHNQFWQQHNRPIELWSAPVIAQKLDYIHENPVEAGIVESAEQYLYSSARNFEDEMELLKLMPL